MTQAEINQAVRSLAYLRCPDKVRAGVRNTYGYSVPLARVERLLASIEPVRPIRAKVDEPRESDGWQYDVRANRYVPVEVKRPAPSRPMLRQREPLPKTVPAPSPNPFAGPFQFKVLAASVGRDFGVTAGDICGNRRFRKLILARIVVTKLCMEQRMSACQIARKMGGRDHTTILNQRDVFDAYAAIYAAVGESYRRHVGLREEARAVRA